MRSTIQRLPTEFEIIVDYKGMRRPSTRRQNGRLDLATYEWQLQNYANLRTRQREGPTVVAGVLLFLNELLPTSSDILEWIGESREDTTDIPCERHWRQPSDIPDETKLKRAIHVTAVTPLSQERALSEFDAVVQKIEACRGIEVAGRSMFAVCKGNPDDKATCDACDAKTFCPELVSSKKRGRMAYTRPDRANQKVLRTIRRQDQDRLRLRICCEGNRYSPQRHRSHGDWRRVELLRSLYCSTTR